MINFILQAGASLAAAAQSPADSTVTTGIQTATALPDTEISLLQMVAKGSIPIMVCLGIMLIVTVYVLVERLLVLGKAGKRHDALVPSLKEFIHTGNISNAVAMCRNMNTPESVMIAQGVMRIGQPVQEIRAAMDKSGSNEVLELEKNLNVLNIIGRIAPMFGFIGTIFGVITIFYDISLAKTVEIEIISRGLYQKMISSASGLVVGVFAFVCYHWLNAKIDKLVRRMEGTQIKFLDVLNEPAK